MNIELFEGQSCLVHVKLPAEWEVYGGTPKGEFRTERESSDSVLVTVPAMEAEFTPLVPYELFARRILDGREWLVLSGQVHVRRRYSEAGGGVSAIEYFVEPQLVEDGISSSPQIIIGIPGPQGPKGDKGDPGEGGMTAEERATLAGAAQRAADNTFTAANTFTGEVDMSGASVTPPEGWNVGELTAKQVQAVVPIAWSNDNAGVISGYANSISLGSGGSTKTSNQGTTALGYKTQANMYSTSLGYRCESLADHSYALGCHVVVSSPAAIGLGASYSDTSGTYECTTQGTGSITIGAGANTKNNGDTESSNSVTIGCKAENKGADSVVIGAQASGERAGSVIIGAGANSAFSGVVIGSSASGQVNSIVLGSGASSVGYCGVAVGSMAKAHANYTVAIGEYALANGLYSTAVSQGANATANYSTALGHKAKAADVGAVVFRSTAQDGTYTQLYFSGANTPLANTYHGGAPMLGYVTKDSAGNIVAAGTRSLIDLLTENSTFAPASLDENGEWVMPKVFHPSDLDMPVEEPSEPEEYTPLPVYPIVEPDDIMGDNGTLEQGGTENTSPATNA